MDFKTCIETRRSITTFDSKPIDENLLKEVIAEASFAPSWKNSQCARYIAVKDADLKAKIGNCTSAYPHNGEIIASAPMLICVTAVKSRSGFERDGSYSTDRENGWTMYDAGIATYGLTLALNERGIGSVIMGIFDRADIEKLLELPEDRELICLVPIGYPAESPACPKRKTVDDLLTII